MGIVCVPLYIRFMGVESYGLVTFLASMQLVLQVLDLGMGPAVTRELAKGAFTQGREQTCRNLVGTVERVYCFVAVVIGLTIVVLATPIAESWLNPRNLDVASLKQALIIAGLMICVRWPFTFYAHGLMGLQQQVHLSWVIIVGTTCKSAGAVLVLWVVSPTIQSFLWVQTLVGACETLVAYWLLRMHLPASPSPQRLALGELSKIWRFSAGMTGIAATGMLLLQGDKVLLSGILPLEPFGYYSLASVLAGTLALMANPIAAALFPRFCQLLVSRDQRGLNSLYHTSCQTVSVVIVPAALVLFFFGEPVLEAWTGNPTVAHHVYPVLRILVIAAAIWALMVVPFCLSVACGWVSLPLFGQMLGLAILVALMDPAVKRWGSEGAALVLVVSYLSNFAATVLRFNTRFFKEQKSTFYVYDLAAPILPALLMCCLVWALVPADASLAMSLGCVGALLGASMGAAALSSPHTRVWIFSKMRTRNL